VNRELIVGKGVLWSVCGLNIGFNFFDFALGVELFDSDIDLELKNNY
jgi:hypothetical protein